jgi:GAF domain-containing protein
MYFVMSDSARRYTEDDFATLQDLAHRAAITMDNATLFREAQQRSRTSAAPMKRRTSSSA